MELSNLITSNPQQLLLPPHVLLPLLHQYHPLPLHHHHHHQPLHQHQQQHSIRPMIVPHQKPLTQIKLPSIHEIINISELNYQIANNSANNNNNNNNSNGSSSSSTTAGPSNYQYKQPQPHSLTSSPFLVGSGLPPVSSANNTTRSSPLNSMSQSPIDTPIFQRSASASSSTMGLDQVSNNGDSFGSTKTGSPSSRSQNGRKGRSNLPKKTTMILLDWLYKNINHPYPNPKQKSELIYQTGLSSQQLSNWFINARRRKIRSLKFQDDEKYLY